MGIDTEVKPGDGRPSGGITIRWDALFTPADGEPIPIKTMTSCYVIDRQRSPVLGITFASAEVYDRLKTGMVGTIEVTELGAKSGVPKAVHRIEDATIVVRTRHAEANRFWHGVVVFVEVPRQHDGRP